MERKPKQVFEDMLTTARAHGLVLATRNTRDFAGIDLKLINSFVG